MDEIKKIGNDPYHIYGIGLLTGEKITVPMDSFSIGHSSNALEPHSFAFGDYAATDKEHQTVVGTHLFREVGEVLVAMSL